MRAAFLIAWCAALAAGAWYLGRREPVKPAQVTTPAAMWTAARALPVNWRLGDGDIVEAAGAPAGKPWAGRYVKSAIAAGKEVTDGGLTGEPAIPQSGTLSVYLLPMAAGDERNLNAGMRIDVIEGRVAVAGNVEVAAVRCAANCEAILQVSPEARERLRSVAAGTPLRWVMR